MYSHACRGQLISAMRCNSVARRGVLRHRESAVSKCVRVNISWTAISYKTSQSTNIDRGDLFLRIRERALITPNDRAPTHCKRRCEERLARMPGAHTVGQPRIQHARRQMIRRSADSVPTDTRLVMGRLPSSRILLYNLPRPNA